MLQAESDGSGALALAPDAVAELRSEHCNIKRWISKAMAEAKRRQQQQQQTAPPPQQQQQHADPSSPATRTGGGAAPAAAAGPDEAAAAALVTLLGVRKQAAAENLEDSIVGALRYLPRATEDVTRLARETSDVRSRLAAVAETATKIRETSAVSDRLKELHQVRERLARCRAVLADAHLLSARVSSVEAAIASLPTAAAGQQQQQRGGGVAGPGKSAGATAAAAAAPADMEDFNRVADDVAAMRAALRTLQGIDPNYGAAVRSQLDRFELTMQRALETQCVDALRREDRAAAPPLLAALGKIGRDKGVLATHCHDLVKSRMDKFKSEVAASAVSAATSADRIPPLLRRFLPALSKVLLKDRRFLLDILPAESSSSSSASPPPGGADADRSSAHTAAASTTGSTSSTRHHNNTNANAPATGRSVLLGYIADVVAAVAAEMSPLFAKAATATPAASTGGPAAASAAATEAVLMYVEDFVGPLTASILPEAETAGSSTAAESRRAIVARALGPVTAFVNGTYADLEGAVLSSDLKEKDASAYLGLHAALLESATRTTSFFRRLLAAAGGAVTAYSGDSSERPLAAARRAIHAVVGKWDKAATAVAQKTLQDAGSASLSSSSTNSGSNSSGSTAQQREALTAALQSYERCAELPAQLAGLQSDLRLALASLAEHLAPAVNAELEASTAASTAATPNLSASVFAAAVPEAAKAPAAWRARVLDILLAPARRHLPTAAGVKAAAATNQAQTDAARELTNWVMEVPMTLEAAGVSNDVQEWMALAVGGLLRCYADSVQGAVAELTLPGPTTGPAGAATAAPAPIPNAVAEILLGDIDDLERVIEAVDEREENKNVFRDLRRAVTAASA